MITDKNVESLMYFAIENRHRSAAAAAKVLQLLVSGDDRYLSKARSVMRDMQNEPGLPEEIAEKLREALPVEDMEELKGEVIRFRCAAKEKDRLRDAALKAGCKSISEYIRAKCLN